MDKEEAIKRFEQMVEDDGELGCLLVSKDIEALDMAISALKGGWIPIEEGKPKHKQMVFVTYDHEGEIKVDKTMYHERHGFAISPNVIAWRDIQPYKKGE